MDFDFKSFLIFGLCLAVPAVIALVVLTFILIRRSKFDRHRINRSSRSKNKETEG
jgi:H+/gluconate symporter-like permease